MCTSTIRRRGTPDKASSITSGLDAALRSPAPGGVRQPVGYYVARGTKVPLMHMYADDAALKIAVSHVRDVLPDVLEFLNTTGFPAETVTTVTADWEDAPEAYTTRTTTLVLQRPRMVSTPE